MTTDLSAATDAPGLMATEGLGAGNFFRLAAASSATARAEILLDQPYRAPSGVTYERLSAAELDELTDRVAAGYHADGIRPKDPVAVFVAESVRYLVHYVALTKVGAIPVFLNSSLDPRIAAAFIEHVGAVAVVSDPGRLAADRLSLTYYEDEPYGEGDFKLFTHEDNDPVLIAHTSGTTGIPKAVQFNHMGFFFGVKQQIAADLGTRILSALPQSHASAISVLMSAFARGATALLATRREPEHIARAVEEFRPHLVTGFPKTFVDLCRVDLDAYDLSSVSRWMSTGDANHERHIRKLVARGNHVDREGVSRPGSLFIDNFGSSEFGFAMFRTVHTPTSDRYQRCIGRPFAWVEVEIFDADDEPVSPGTVGRLALKSPTITGGYWNNSLLSEKNRIRGHWLTGDLAYLGEDGLYYHVDRTTDRIVTAWGTLYSAQTEELILRHFPDLVECSVVGVDTGDEGVQTPVLSIETPASEAELDALRERVNQLLAERDWPLVERVVVKDADAHLGVTGKALKRAMRVAFADS
ncbi:class I adenylate-forming enzyme family protein [Streptomyces sp. NPDC059070]|uniref:class I adenylate-forming enzyme family protein n=1 Tax=unclassified Streptomyces TaxID=2593676 RepID=UPI0034E27729